VFQELIYSNAVLLVFECSRSKAPPPCAHKPQTTTRDHNSTVWKGRNSCDHSDRRTHSRLRVTPKLTMSTFMWRGTFRVIRSETYHKMFAPPFSPRPLLIECHSIVDLRPLAVEWGELVRTLCTFRPYRSINLSSWRRGSGGCASYRYRISGLVSEAPQSVSRS